MTIEDTRTPASSQTDGVSTASEGETNQGEQPLEAGKSIGWHKAYIEGSRPDLRVPVRQVHLTNGQSVTLYDTSGPYTDPTTETDVRRGLLPSARTGSSPGETPRSTRAVLSAPRTTGSSTPRRVAGCATSTRCFRGGRASHAVAVTAGR